MKRYLLLLSIVISITLPVKATTYYSVGDGGWTSSIWSSGCSTCTPGSALPTLVDGDIIIIDDQVTISSGTVTIAASVKIILRTDLSPNTTLSPAKLIFTGGGKLNLGNSSSSVVLENNTAGASPNPIIDGTGNGNSNTIVVSGVTFWTTNTGTGDLQGVGTLQPGGVLPIKLISFVATDLANSIQLRWVTAMERNFSHFELEKSNGNLNFVPIARIEAKGGLEVITSYTYLDSSPQSGKNYYRLKSVDYDLTFEYSPVVVADSKTEKQLVIYPNPSQGEPLNLMMNFHPEEQSRIEIFNSLGVKLDQIFVSEFTNDIKLPAGLKTGTYLLRFTSRTYSQVVRFSVL